MRKIKETPAPFRIERLPKGLQAQFHALYKPNGDSANHLKPNQIYHGDARTCLAQIEPNSISLSVWSPPYFVGKAYEAQLSFQDWQTLLSDVIELHFPILKPGGFLVINIADILVFKDTEMPRIQAEVPHRRKSFVTREAIVKAMQQHPTYNRQQLAKLLGCSEQTIDRRLHGNNIRGGKQETQTRVKIVGGLVEQWALEAGFYPYDRRVWVKDAAWENSRWASLSYRAVDEFEYVYFFWKPGITKFDRSRLSPEEWSNWGSRGVWAFPSVRANDDHEAKFPLELPTRVIRLLTDPDEIVLDCFMGSGTTALAALREGRRYIGIEQERKYVKLARENISKRVGVYVNDPRDLANDLNRLEEIEKASQRMVTQALWDFRDSALEIFEQEADLVADIGEDITREALDRMGMSKIDQRLFGKVDYKRARYIFHPEYAVKQALFVDSKAEKVSGQSTATLQISQFSMTVRQIRRQREVAVVGKIPTILFVRNEPYLTTTIFVKYNYAEIQNAKSLHSITIAALPNGLLQEKYNPNSQDTLWLAGRNSPQRGEEFRVRLDFASLKRKANWRVQRIPMPPEAFTWDA